MRLDQLQISNELVNLHAMATPEGNKILQMTASKAAEFVPCAAALIELDLCP